LQLTRKHLVPGLVVMALALVASLARPAPVVMTSGPKLFSSSSSSSSSGGGSLTDGGTFTLSGSGFGTNVSAANQIYEAPAIEGQSNGTLLTDTILGSSDWTVPGEDDHLISTARSYNSTRSIRNAWSGSNSQFGFQRNLSTTYDALYTEAYLYLDTGSQADGQLKLWRMGSQDSAPGEGLQDSDVPNVFYQYYPLTDGGDGQFPCNLVVNNAEAQDAGNTSFNDGGEKMLQRSAWTRVQGFLIPGSAGTANGSAQVRSTRMDTNAVVCNTTRTSRIFRATSQPEYQRLMYQFYIGNGFQVSGATVDIDGWFYAIYNDVDTTFPKIVWFCNKSTWAAVGTDSDAICVVQPFATWSDTTITGTFNQGQLAGLTCGTHFWGYVLSAINTSINSSGITCTTAVMDAVNDPYAFIDLELAA
jgi:hypothetical protein